MTKTDHVIGAVMALAVLGWILAIIYLAVNHPETSSNNTPQDLASHLEMCENRATEVERPACINTAYQTWEK
jgi:hypothetical protein